MTMQFLVTYVSHYGSTAEIAAHIGEVLRRNGVSVETMPTEQVESLESYEGVIVGGAIYSGEWPGQLIDFINAYQDELRQKHTAAFIVAMRLRKTDEEIREALLAAVQTHLSLLDPVMIGLFAGKVDYASLSPIVRLQVQTKKLPEGDFRDWNAIESWASSLASQLDEA